MAARIENTKAPATGASQVPKSNSRHGLVTPETTPAPEDAKITADKERNARAAKQGSMPSIVEISDSEEASTAQSKPAFDVGSQDDRESDSDSDEREAGEGDEAPPPSQAQVEAVEYVLACPRKDYRKILKLGPVADDARQEKENVLNSFNRITCLVHPRFNSTKGAEKAFQGKSHFMLLISVSYGN